MANKKFIVELDVSERVRLDTLISKGKAAAKTILKARILLKADQGPEGDAWTDDKICTALDTNVAMVSRVRRQLIEEGLDAVLTRKKRTTPPVAPIFDGEARAGIGRYLSFYNSRRPHSSLDRHTPDRAYFNLLQPIPAAA